MASWLDIPADTDFPLSVLPYGVFRNHDSEPWRVGVVVGDRVLCLATAARTGLLDGTVEDPVAVFSADSLNPLLAAGRPIWQAVRARITELLTDTRHTDAVSKCLVLRAAVENRLPFGVADYVDFYSSQHHAENVGRMFRPDSEPLTPNWKHLPIGYHGRAGTVVVSGTPIVRPRGQRKPPQLNSPVFGPSQRLDIEAEVGFVVGLGSELGHPVSPQQMADHVFGVVLVNDWSARDIQAWEYVPLGPFLGKSFATSISAWVVPLEALASARTQPPAQDPAVLPYLADPEPWSLDLDIEVELNGEVVSRPPFASMYWSPGQQLAHMTVNGASLRTGDLFGSGTVSGPGKDQRGSLMELSWGGQEPFTTADGVEHTFLIDRDTVTLRASFTTVDGQRGCLGEVTGTILPAVE